MFSTTANGASEKHGTFKQFLSNIWVTSVTLNIRSILQKMYIYIYLFYYTLYTHTHTHTHTHIYIYLHNIIKNLIKIIKKHSCIVLYNLKQNSKLIKLVKKQYIDCYLLLFN